jgi:hypothetical protein
MKKLIVLLLIATAFKASAQVEGYVQFNQKGAAVPDFNIYGEGKITSKLNYSYFGLVDPHWAEGLGGVDYYPAKWIAIGVMGGFEQNPGHLFRKYASLWLGKDKTSLSLLFEKGHGSDNYWYKHTASYRFSDQFTLAGRAWRYNGVGPVALYSIKKTSITIWTMPAHDFEFHQNRLLIGFDIKP